MTTYTVHFRHSGYLVGKLAELVKQYGAKNTGASYGSYRAEFETEEEATDFYKQVRSCSNILSLSLTKEETLIVE